MVERDSEVEVAIEKVASGGAGLGRIDGRVVFVPYTLPGERVLVEIVDVRKDFLRAVPKEILEASPARIASICPLFTRCGGCDFLHCSYDLQTVLKKELFLETFRRTAGIVFSDVEILSSRPFGYRNRVRAHRTAEGRAGFKEGAGSRVVEVGTCPVSSDEVNGFFASLKRGAPPLDRECCVVFGWGGKWFREDRDEVVEAGLLGRTFVFSPGCFFQSNTAMLELLLPFVLEALPGGGLVLDLYGGVGTFSAFLGERYDRVVLVEENPEAVLWARRNLPAGRTGFFAGRVEAWTSSAGRRADAVMVDPPRTGLSKQVLAFLLGEKPKRLVYLSCDAVTLARDAKILVAGGFSLESYKIFDFYPQTAHLESLCVFSW